MPKKREFHPPAKENSNGPDPLSFSTPDPDSVLLVYNMAGSKAIVKGKSGIFYEFTQGIPVSVMANDAPELLRKTRKYRPCCSGQEKEINIFSLVK